MKKILYFGILACLFVSYAFSYTESEVDSANILAEREVINLQNNSDDYRLDDTITRREFMKVVVKIVGEQVENNCQNKFDDVIAGDWGCKYIEWALKKSFIASNPTFRPNDQITKAESMKLILKARNIARIENSDDWRQDDMRTAYRKGIISSEYRDYDTFSTRGWIFEAVATPTSGTGGGTGADSSSTSGGGESVGTSSSSGVGSTSSSSGEGGSDTFGDDWRNKVP